MDVLFTAECDVCSGVVLWLGRHSYIPCRPCLAQVGAVGSRLWQGAVRRCGSMIDLAVWYPTIEPRCSAASAAISQAMIWKGPSARWTRHGGRLVGRAARGLALIAPANAAAAGAHQPKHHRQRRSSTNTPSAQQGDGERSGAAGRPPQDRTTLRV